MDADFARERRRTLLALGLAVTAGFLPLIVGTWVAARRTTTQYPTSGGLGTMGISLMFGAISCLAIVVLAGVLVNRYHRLLVRAATRDHLTGAYNRQALEVAAAEAMSAALREKRPLSVVLFDVDEFKPYNDTHGHMAGDAALREVVRVALRVVRSRDVVSRWGGDEFVLLLPACPKREALRIAGSLSSAVQAAAPEPGGMPAHVSISAGVAELQPGDRIADLIARADEDMYRNRRAARSSNHRSSARRTTRSPGHP